MRISRFDVRMLALATALASFSLIAPPASAAEEEALLPEDAPALVVDATGAGDFRTIGEAIAQAAPGARIVIRPGLYREALVTDKPLHLEGMGESIGDVRIEAEGAPCLIVTAESGTLARLTMKTVGRGNAHCLDIRRGRIVVEEVDLSSRRGSVVAVHGPEAEPLIRKSRLHHGWEAGLLVFDGARGRYEENDIFANALAGVAVTAGGDPLVAQCRIRDGKKVGVDVFQGGRGRFERNDIAGNSASGVSVREGGDPVLIGNTIRGNAETGIWIYNGGLGRFEQNTILDNRLEGIDVQSGAPVVLGNRLRGNQGGDLVIREGAEGTIEGNREGE
jgi:parallel beta-helix repeat protein